MSVSSIRPETRAPAMEPLAQLPVFLALAGKRAIVAGDSAAAAWKAELISAAGATVEVFATDPSPELVGLAGETPRGRVTICRRAWSPADFADATLAGGAI